MKNFYTLFVVALIGFIGNAQIVNIPDANFKAKLLQANQDNNIASLLAPIYNNNNYYDYGINGYNSIDSNSDGEIQVSEAQAIKFLNISDSNITDLTGIEAFVNLVYFDCSSNLINLNMSQLTSIRYLFCSNTGISNLGFSDLNNIEILVCGGNNNFTNFNNLLLVSYSLKRLDISGCNFSAFSDFSPFLELRILGCFSSNLNSLNVSGLTNLLTLECSNNNLTTLDLNGLSNLTGVSCANNQISSLDFSNLNNLIDLLCSNNQLTTLNVSGLQLLSNLECTNNQLTTLNIANTPSLNVLYCGNNQIATLDLAASTNLQYFLCANNLLTALDVSAATSLLFLYCDNNNLNSLNIKNGTNEDFNISGNPNLEYVCTDEGNETEIFQILINNGALPNCHVNSYCSFTPGGTYYTIEGTNRFDSDTNGCDVNDINYSNLKFSFSDGFNIGNYISDYSGSYHYDVQAGTHTITPILESPSYFTISPTSTTVTFPDETSPFHQDFCISANGVHNDLEIALIPIDGARPGFDSNYKIIFKNKGTTTQSGAVNFTYDDSVLDFVAANPSITGQGTDNLNWSFATLLPFETREILITLNLNSPLETPPVNSGNLIIFSANVAGNTDETDADNTLTFTQTVVNSFDPNDKTCIEGTVITPSMVGKYVHYVIRFENTGTANAENIVVKDIIDTTKFDLSSLIPLNGSALYETRIKNENQVEFIFENINLPFDDVNNDGYVAFKIKTLPTLVDGDVFSNSASIYFDYNAPIVTDPYVTTITALGTPDFEFSSLFAISPVPAKNVLTITNKQDVEISSISIYNMLGQLIQITTNPNESIDTSGLKVGSYFIKIISDKGTVSTKFVKE